MYAERMAAEAFARGDYVKAEYWRRVIALVDEAPPLTEEQRSKLRTLLRPAAASETAVRLPRLPAVA